MRSSSEKKNQKQNEISSTSAIVPPRQSSWQLTISHMLFMLIYYPISNDLKAHQTSHTLSNCSSCHLCHSSHALNAHRVTYHVSHAANAHHDTYIAAKRQIGFSLQKKNKPKTNFLQNWLCRRCSSCNHVSHHDNLSTTIHLLHHQP